MNVLVIDAHPREDSFCHALAVEAILGVKAGSHDARLISLREARFDLNHKGQAMEPCLDQARRDILWAQHVIFIHPVWWGSMPALLKGWLDRVFQPGFAFSEREDGGWEGMLSGRSATIISTLDTPLWIYQWILRAPSIRALRDSTLRFCGICPVKVLLLGPVRHSSAEQRQLWLAEAKRTGHELEQTLHTGWMPRAKAWLRAIRPQFYVFPALALTTGAINAASHGGTSFSWAPFLLALLGIWTLEAITVFTNEIHDLATDTNNRNSGPFTGGSRVLVEGALSESQLRRGRIWAGSLLALVSISLAFMPAVNLAGACLLLVTGLILGIGYTTPPLKFAYRTWGEVVVAFTHSVLVVMLGHFSQGGRFDWQPLLVAGPIFFAILPSITLAGFPDMEADAAAGKQTWVVRFGRTAAIRMAMLSVVIAASLRIAVLADPLWLSAVILVHASALLLTLTWLCRKPRAGRINGILALALSYMFWFAWIS